MVKVESYMHVLDLNVTCWTHIYTERSVNPFPVEDSRAPITTFYLLALTT